MTGGIGAWVKLYGMVGRYKPEDKLLEFLKGL